MIEKDLNEIQGSPAPEDGEQLQGPAVVEKINLAEIEQEKNNILKEQSQAKQAKIDALFNDFIKNFKALSQKDAEQLIVMFAEKKIKE